MATKRIHELPAANLVDPADQVLISTASGNLTRRAGLASLPYRASAAQAVLRTLADKLGELASVRDYGAVGDGVADDAPAFQRALDAHTSVQVPAGRYRLASEVQVKPRRTIVGAGRDATVLQAEAARAFTFHRNAGAYVVDAAGTSDWCRSRLAQLSLRMTTGGVKVHGHEFHGEGLRFSGGAAGAWCLELEDANEFSLREVAAGTGGGNDDLLANGIRVYGSEAGRGVNYGDALLQEIAIKLKSVGSIGIKVEHTGSQSAGRWFVMNNLLLNRVQVNSASPPAGSVGIWLVRTMRSALVNVDVEFVANAFRIEGVAGGGNAGSCRHLSFVGCYVLNCTTPWQDSNGVLAGSVMRCLFNNCNGFGLLNPVGVASDDAAARAGEGDTFMPGGLWLNEPSQGAAAVQLRASNPGQLLVTGDFHDGTSPVRDGNPKNKLPRRALGIDVTSLNATQLYRPRGDAGADAARLVLGNGEVFRPDGATAAPLHRVEVADPLYLTKWGAPPPATYGGNTTGILINAGSAAVLGAPATGHYVGPGLYQLLDDSTGGTFASLWNPVAPRPGFGVAHTNRSGSAYELDRAWFGKLSGMANPTDSTITVPPGLIRADEDLADTHRTAARFWVRRGANGRIVFAGAAGVTLYTDGTTSSQTSIEIPRPGQTVEVVYVRTGAATADLIVVGGNPISISSLTGWRQVVDADVVVAASDLGQLVRVNSSANRTVTVPTGLLPAGVTAAWLKIAQEGIGKVNILAGAGMAMLRPNNQRSQLEFRWSVLTLHVLSDNTFWFEGDVVAPTV